MRSADRIIAGALVLFSGLVVWPACSSSDAADACANGVRDGDEAEIDCGGGCALTCEEAKTRPRGSQTDVGCGGPNAPKCVAGKSCLVDRDCEGICNEAKRCVESPSCRPHLGGDTCGKGEVGQSIAQHESCCRTLPVAGYSDAAHPGKTVYLDKYEITAGRVRAFLEDIAAKNGGKPKVRDWIASNEPAIWDTAWNEFLPNDVEGDTVRVDRRLLGDVRGGPDEPPPPAADQDQSTGTDYQFNGQLFVYIHGNNCSTHEGSYGFPTFFYPPSVLAKTGPDTFPARAEGTDFSGRPVPAKEHLDVKAMNCITNALLVAFCHWDGGQLATDEVLDFVTDTPRSGDDALGDRPGCGSQIGTEVPPKSDAATKGGRCADLAKINATFDAGGQLPEKNSPLNRNNYEFPLYPKGVTHDKAWEIAAPGRGSLGANGEAVDTVRIEPGDEPWMDLAGNLNESVLTTKAGKFTGKFGLKYRGIGYNSARSELNFKGDWPGEGGLRRIERPESRAGFAGGRCMRFR